MTNVQDKMSNVQGQMVNAVESAKEAAHSAANKVTDFFQGNPFETVLGRKIELATDATKLATENWGLNMEICDFINNTNEGGRDAIRAIRKRLQSQIGKNNAIVMYTLTLLETCVKNCNQRFKALVCQKEFINDLLIGAKFDAPQVIQERVLSLIQSWADAFRGNPALVGVTEAYDELKSKGVEFPAVDLDSLVPILTPRRTVFDSPPEIPVGPVRGPVSASPEQLAKLRSELDVVNVNLTVLRELLGTLTPNQEEAGEWELLQGLYTTSKEMQKRILELIGVITNEEVTYELLFINDEFNNVFEKYNRYISNRSSQPTSSGTSKSISAPAANDLIDLSGTNTNALSEQLQSFDLHQAQPQASTKFGKNENYVNDQTTAGISTAAFNKTEPISEREAQEISGWLESDKTESQKKEEKKVDDGL
uniref:TOM1-like protein 2 n=1 Tax=Ditylenchus dipsaci TaxID=166011 RepID=A0A915CZJ3_9BILA